jgi:transcriptional regulator with XRE-family HTH domain
MSMQPPGSRPPDAQQFRLADAAEPDAGPPPGDDALTDADLAEAGTPELTALGTRIEMLRIQRRLTKRTLARRADISRQQLWRVMTGKSELTSALAARLADALEADSRVFAAGTKATAMTTATATPRVVLRRTPAPPETDLAAYVADRAPLERTLGTLPAGEHGRQLKRAFLNAVEDLAAAQGIKLPAHFFDLRREVVNGER